MEKSFEEIFKGMNVLVTGNTGFKGSWLSIWLNELGANVIGYSIGPPTKISNFELSDIEQKITDVRGDVRDFEKLFEVIEKYRPQVVFHLAAQPIVLKAYDNPKLTIDTNVGGTLNVLEAVRRNSSVKALVCITSDKCYANQDWSWGYRENDSLGGHDPYSASKAMAELAISTYNNSFFLPNKEDGGVAVSSVRAGNVIGGGDFADFRLVPDCMRALINHIPIEVRNPKSVRPWQIVFEPLSGYLWLATKLLKYGKEFSGAWNFGPMEQKGVTAQEIAEKSVELWGAGSFTLGEINSSKKETKMLRLNWDKAASSLHWSPSYTWEEALLQTVDWFKAYSKMKETDSSMYEKCVEDIKKYTEKAHQLNRSWAL